MTREPHPIILTGPTGSGKTAAVLELARLLPARVISADSMQVYRRLDIGTAKPTPADRARVLHYGIDVAEPDRLFSVAEWVGSAVAGVQETLQAGEWPIITGGARLYLYALTGPFDAGPPPDPELRERLEREAMAVGPEALHRQLSELDPSTAGRLHPHDLKRIVRALEVSYVGGGAISKLQEMSHRAPRPVDARWFALTGDRAALYGKVESRTASMIDAGWLEEVASLLSDGYGPAIDEIKAHGYRELAAYLNGAMGLEDAVSAINQNVRNFVRYQLGWIRRLPDVTMLDAGASPAENARKLYREIVTG